MDEPTKGGVAYNSKILTYNGFTNVQDLQPRCPVFVHMGDGIVGAAPLHSVTQGWAPESQMASLDLRQPFSTVVTFCINMRISRFSPQSRWSEFTSGFNIKRGDRVLVSNTKDLNRLSTGVVHNFRTCTDIAAERISDKQVAVYTLNFSQPLSYFVNGILMTHHNTR